MLRCLEEEKLVIINYFLTSKLVKILDGDWGFTGKNSPVETSP